MVTTKIQSILLSQFFTMKIINIEESLYPHVVNIYLEGIATGHATFQTEATSWTEWHKSHLPHSRLAVMMNDEITAWAALSPVSGRCVYAGVAEVSIYVAAKHRSRGIGKLLFEKLIQESEQHGLWTLQSGIFPENIASISMHKAFGFRIVGYREKIGMMNNVWRDTVIMERRSKIVGI